MDIDLSKYFIDAMSSNCKTMFDEDIKLIEVINNTSFRNSLGVAVIVGITGKIKGHMIVDTTLEVAKVLATEFGMDVNDEDSPLYMMAELANTVSGYATTEINNDNKEWNLRLAPPSIFSGSEMRFSTAVQNNIAIYFESKHGNLMLNIVLEGE
jgi:CheY-specific phosphatase CheX